MRGAVQSLISGNLRHASDTEQLATRIRRTSRSRLEEARLALGGGGGVGVDQG